MRAAALLLIIATSGLLGTWGCQADTEPLELRGRDAAPPITRDASSVDATPGPVDAADPDSGVLTCSTADECPGVLPACDDLPSCRCGCFRTCTQGRCIPFCDQGPSCHATDAGVRNECILPSECPPQPFARACGGMGSPSCAFERCVGGCGGGVRCVTSGNDCVECGPPDQPAPVSCPSCINIGLRTARVEESSCDLAVDTDVELTFQPADCSFDVRMPGVSGRLQPYDNGILIGYLDAFPGPCIVELAPTGAIRTVWGCPGCTFSLFHF